VINVTVNYSFTSPNRPLGLQEFEAPSISRHRHMKEVRLSALSTYSLYAQEIYLVLISVRPQDHSAAGKIRSMKNPIDPIWNRTRNLPACSE